MLTGGLDRVQDQRVQLPGQMLQDEAQGPAGKAIADYLCLHDETVDDSKDLPEIFRP